MYLVIRFRNSGKSLRRLWIFSLLLGHFPSRCRKDGADPFQLPSDHIIYLCTWFNCCWLRPCPTLSLTRVLPLKSQRPKSKSASSMSFNQRRRRRRRATHVVIIINVHPRPMCIMPWQGSSRYQYLPRGIRATDKTRPIIINLLVRYHKFVADRHDNEESERT